MYIIAGLGNPTRKYEKTKHNIGFRVMDAYANRHEASFDKKAFNSLCAYTVINGEKALLLKPQTYMNLSGAGLSEAASFYKVEACNIILIYDDVELDTGKIRIRSKGSAGTHNGMKSVIECLGTKDIARIRIGIGPETFDDLAQYVLSPFSKEQEEILSEVIPLICDVIDTILTKGVDIAMNKFNPKKQKKLSQGESGEDTKLKDAGL